MMTENNFKRWGTGQPFETPDGYFVDFEYRLKKRIGSIKKREKRTLTVSIAGIAAAVVIAVLLYAQSPGFRLNMLVKRDMAAPEYIVTNISSDDIDENELMEYINEKDISIDVFPYSLLFEGIDEDELFSLALTD